MARTRARADTKRKTVKKKSVDRKPTRLFYIFLGITLIYACISYFGPIDKAAITKYNISTAAIRNLSLTIIIPMIAIWCSAFYGFSRVKHYAKAVSQTDEGPAFTRIAQGLGVLAFSLPINAIVTSTINGILVNHQSYVIPLTIIKNYWTIVLPLIAFSLIFRGSLHLSEKVRRRKDAAPYKQEIWTFGVILMTSLFTWLVIARPADDRTPLNVYQLPDWLIVLTLIVPYLYTWLRGIFSTYYIGYYQQNVKGSIYRSSLKRLSTGIFVVVCVNILIQVIISVSARLFRLHLTPLLLIVYLLIVMYAVGFGLIASGAKKLKKIEDV